jgi:hypothetical protein
MRTSPSRNGITRSSVRVTSKTTMGNVSLQELVDELEARAVGPREPVDDDHERLLERQRTEQHPKRDEQHVTPIVPALFFRCAHRLFAGGDLGQASHQPLGGSRFQRDLTQDAAKHSRRLVQRVVEADACRLAQQVAQRRERDLALDGGALDRQHTCVTRQLAQERGDQRRLADAHLTDDRARDELAPRAGGARRVVRRSGRRKRGRPATLGRHDRR